MPTRTEPTPQHTPTPDPFTLPWRGATDDDEGVHILSANDSIVCAWLNSDDLMEFILNRVNSHAALFDALEYVVAAISAEGVPSSGDALITVRFSVEELNDFRAALDAARVKP